MGVHKKGKVVKKRTLKNRKIVGGDALYLPKENVIPVNLYHGSSVDPNDPGVLISSRLVPQQTFLGGKSKKYKKGGKQNKKGQTRQSKKNIKGGSIFDNDPISRTSRYDMNAVSAGIGSIPGSVWSYNQLSGVGNSGGPQLEIHSRPVAMV